MTPSPESNESIAPYHAPEAVEIKPIGVVRNSIVEPEYIHWNNVISEVIIDPVHLDAIRDLYSDYSHALILFWFHEVCMVKERHVPQGKHDMIPEVGMFSCRCPHRPNPIGVTTVEIIDQRANVITVKGLDAINNTPVVDIKPYTPQFDFVCRNNETVRDAISQSVRVPDWIFHLTY